MDNPRENISGLILAGGAGRRFGGADKGLIEFQGTKLIQHVIDRLTSQVRELYISCNRNFDSYAAFGYPLVKDDSITQSLQQKNATDSYQGPLIGIASTMSQVTQGFLLVSSCDCPFLPGNLSADLYAALKQNKADVSYVFDGDRYQYLASLWDISKTREKLQVYLRDGGRSVKGLYETLDVAIADLSGQQDAFTNINQPGDMQR